MRALVLSILVAALTTPPALAETVAAEAAVLPPPEASSDALPAISVTTVAPRHMVERIVTTGLVLPVEEVLVQPQIEGQQVEWLGADVGDMVAAGEVLARLSSATLELQKAQQQAAVSAAEAVIAQAGAQISEAEATAADIARTAARMARLHEQGNATDAALESARSAATAASARVGVMVQAHKAAQAQLALAEAQLAYLDLQLARTEVRAPFPGRISARNATLGAIASAAGPAMFVIERDGALEVRADLAETDVLRAATGQKALITPPGASEAIPGSLRLVEPVIDLASRLGRARIHIADNSTLRTGLFVRVEIVVSERDALAVPVTALGAEDGRSTVMLLGEGDRIERREVTPGIRDQGWVEVGGLSAGDRAVTKAGAFVRPGDRIRPVAGSPGG